MPVDLTKKMADQTWETRLKMDELVKAGIAEDEALAELMSGDPHRDTKLKVWRERGLWPITDAERGERITETGSQDAFDLDSLLCSGGDDCVCCDSSETVQSQIPDEALQEILAAVRVTVNAAIMDYHNVQIVHMEDQIAALQRKVEQLERGQRDPLQPSSGEPSEHAPAEAASGSIDHTKTPQAAHRELVAPPQPRTVFGSREQVTRQAEITARCDSALLDLFERDMRERGYDRDRMMDFVLYNFYDRPALSFQ